MGIHYDFQLTWNTTNLKLLHIIFTSSSSLHIVCIMQWKVYDTPNNIHLNHTYASHASVASFHYGTVRKREEDSPANIQLGRHAHPNDSKSYENILVLILTVI